MAEATTAGPVRHQQFRIGGLRIHTQICGEGEPLLLYIKRPTSTVAALYRMAPLFGWTSLPWLWAIRQPTLVIAGDDDPITPLVNHRVIAMLMPHATLRVMKVRRV